MPAPMIPPTLKAGDKVVIVSPSGKVDEQFLQGAVARLEAWGLQPVLGEYATTCYGRYAGTPEQRATDLQCAIDDPETHAIWCSRGGYGAIQIIDSVDFSSFELNPKWLIGFSDITVLHSALTALDVVSVHGAMAKQLTLNADDDESLTRLHDILFGRGLEYRLPPHSLNRAGRSQGILTGGNLSILQSLRGTHYDLFPEGKILFIEDIGEAPYQIDRMLQNLKVGGVLENLSGLVVGQFTDYEEDPLMLRTVAEGIADAMSDYDYPVLFDFPTGHTPRNLPLALGGMHTLEVSEQASLLRWEKS